MKDKNGEHPFGDAGQIILLMIFLVVWAGDSFVFHISTIFSEYLFFAIRAVLFVICLFIGIILFRSGHVVVQAETRMQRIVKTGSFRYVRHPLYLASMITYFGLAVLTGSFVSMLLLVIIFIFYNYIANYEETILEKRFGRSYKRYKKQTGKWIPKF